VNALWPLALALVVGLVFHQVIGPRVGGYVGPIIVICAINVVLAVSLTVVNGFAGQFSLGHAGFMAVGGYAAAAVVYYGTILLWGHADPAGGVLSFPAGQQITFANGQAGPPSWLTAGDLLFVAGCLCGSGAAAFAGYVVGLPSLRLRGDYLAIVTLGFGEIVRVLLQGTLDQIPKFRLSDIESVPWWELPVRLGGPQGFNLLPKYTTLFWATAVATLTLVLVARLKSSALGREFLSIREDEVAAQAMGVNVTRSKVRAFVIAAALAGLAGGLYAMELTTINASDLGFLRSIEIVIMVVLGGMGSISGAALAAVLLTVLPQILLRPPAVWPAGLVVLVCMAIAQWRRGRWSYRTLITVVVVTALLEGGRRFAISRGVNLADYRLVIYALVLIVMMLVRPQGLLGSREVWELWRPRRPAAPPLDPAVESSI
jgi:branched-chain amino acid transport system permease protein